MGFLKRLFGNESRERDTTYTGTKPRTSLLQGAGGRESFDEIMRRMSGEGVGFSPGTVSAVTDPRVAKSRATFNRSTLPELRSELSATGVRRAPGGFKRLSSAFETQGLEEGDIFSRVLEREEQQKRNEINQAVQDLQAFNRGDVNQTNNAANFDYNAYRNILGDASSQKKAQDQFGKDAVNMSVSAIAAPFTGGASLGNLGGTQTATSLPSGTTGTIGQSGVPTLRGALGDPNESAIDRLLRQMGIK